MNEIVNSLKKFGYIVKTFDDVDEVKEELLLEISEDDTVGIGGSMTILDSGIYETLENRGNKVYWHWKSEDKKQALEMAKTASTYISSVNAITEDGKILNMDANGNRVASLIYGHDKVFLIIGKNKICKDYDSARERIRNIAAPKNAKRLSLKTPCTITGKCSDCNSIDSICITEVIFHKKPKGSNMYIYLVNQDLGY